MLSGNEGESYVLVTEFTDEQIRQAAATAIDEWSLATEDVPKEAITKLAATAMKYRFREHVTVDEDCERGGDCGPGWWCEFGDGKTEGLYAGFEFAVGEQILIDALDAREVSDGE
jgi:hypothetical protein